MFSKAGEAASDAVTHGLEMSATQLCHMDVLSCRYVDAEVNVTAMTLLVLVMLQPHLLCSLQLLGGQ